MFHPQPISKKNPNVKLTYNITEEGSMMLFHKAPKNIKSLNIDGKNITDIPIFDTTEITLLNEDITLQNDFTTIGSCSIPTSKFYHGAMTSYKIKIIDDSITDLGALKLGLIMSLSSNENPIYSTSGIVSEGIEEGVLTIDNEKRIIEIDTLYVEFLTELIGSDITGALLLTAADDNGFIDTISYIEGYHFAPKKFTMHSSDIQSDEVARYICPNNYLYGGCTKIVLTPSDSSIDINDINYVSIFAYYDDIGYGKYLTSLSIDKFINEGMITIIGNELHIDVIGISPEFLALKLNFILSDTIDDTWDTLYFHDTDVTVNHKFISFESGGVHNVEIMLDNTMFYNRVAPAVTSVEFSNVNVIGDASFENCKMLTNATFDDALQSIGSGGFFGCSGLTNIVFGENLLSLGDSIFDYCYDLKNITCKAMSAPTITSSTFEYMASNGTLYVPEGATGYDEWLKEDYYYLGAYGWTLEYI